MNDLRTQLEQPLTLAYLSCVTMSMLDAHARKSDNPGEYLSNILDTAKTMMSLVVSEQMDQYKEQMSIAQKEIESEGENFQEFLTDQGIPNTEQFQEIVDSVVNAHADKFDAYQQAVVEDIASKN